MGLMCGIWGHSDEAINLLDNDGNFTLFRCRRCKREIIHCAYEGEILNNDDEGRGIMAQMQRDPEFSRQCHIYWRFVQVETNNSFKYDAQEKGFEEIRKEFGLPPGYRQPNPLILFKKGLWKPKAGESSEKRESTQKKKPSAKKNVGKEKSVVAKKEGENKVKNKFKLSEEDKINLMKKKLNGLVSEEKYEEAAKLRDEIAKMDEKKD